MKVASWNTCWVQPAEPENYGLFGVRTLMRAKQSGKVVNINVQLDPPLMQNLCFFEKGSNLTVSSLRVPRMSKTPWPSCSSACRYEHGRITWLLTFYKEMQFWRMAHPPQVEFSYWASFFRLAFPSFLPFLPPTLHPTSRFLRSLRASSQLKRIFNSSQSADLKCPFTIYF